MGLMKLTKPERMLVKDVEHGDETRYETKEHVSAEVLRRIVLGLPLFRRGIGPGGREAVCRTTGAGVSIRNAFIKGPLRLDGAIGCHGGPLCSLEFRNCTFDDVFSGAHAHFSRLSFRDCSFIDGGGRKDPDTRLPLPTIDLSGARLDEQLDMTGIRPEHRETGLLWIRGAGIYAAGGVEMAGCRLRAPGPLVRPQCDEVAQDALDLSVTEIRGDLNLHRSHLTGRLKLRGARISGELWLRNALIEKSGEKQEAILLQGARICGFLTLDSDEGFGEPPSFQCKGSIDLTAAEVGRSLIVLKAVVDGEIDGPDLTVRDDFFLHARVAGSINLEHTTIGGSLDLADLKVEGVATAQAENDPGAPPLEDSQIALSLKDSRIGRALRLAPTKRHPDATFRLKGTVDLTGLTCDTLDDEVGQRWGRDARVKMNHFIYKQTGWLRERHDQRPSHKILGDWLLAKRAEGRWPLNWLPARERLQKEDFWEPWQLRRNWIYQQTETAKRNPISIARQVVDERHYHPQPFEQAIRVARAEGREDSAIHFEMLKQGIEWCAFNGLVRWWLGFAGIALGSLWLVLHQGLVAGRHFNWGLLGGTLIALMATLLLMVGATRVHSAVRWLLWLERGRLSIFLTWVVFFFPVLLLVAHSDWGRHPFHFLVAAMIFIGIRFVSVLAHAVMRSGFGYLRRPVRAIITLILAFVVGWWGVDVANERHMLVVAAEPVAPLVGAERREPAPRGPLLMGSEAAAGRNRFIRDISCAHELSEPLYALDVLIPLVDLREESRCEVRRLPEPGRRIVRPENLGWGELVRNIPDLPLNDHRFWWWMQALYAIAGWIIVSLALLTFAQVNRTRGEGAGMGE